MSLKKRSKDNLKDHAGLALVTHIQMPTSDNPLQFWTNHPSNNTLVDLQSFATGEVKNVHPYGGKAGNWAGPFSGRPTLINELSPILKKRLSLASQGTTWAYLGALRAWWRLFDNLECIELHEGHRISRVESVADLNALHENAAHLSRINPGNFKNFLFVVNEARHLQGLPRLTWTPSNQAPLDRELISEKSALEIKTALKQDWQRVRNRWQLYADIQNESAHRAAGGAPNSFSIENERLLKNWQHFERIVLKTGQELPEGSDFADDKSNWINRKQGLQIPLMRAIAHPTVQEADIAFHLALLNSGWNPSTLCAINALEPFLVSSSPGNGEYIALTHREDDQNEGITVSADKARAGGRTQFCTSLKKDPNGAPMIVATYLDRTKKLRSLLKKDLDVQLNKLQSLEANGTHTKEYAQQFQRVQQLKQGMRSVWLYLDKRGKINWIDWRHFCRYPHPDQKKGERRLVSWLFLVLHRIGLINSDAPQSPVTPSDFRDIYARWVYLRSGGNILSVMLALGHSHIDSTIVYLEKSVYNADYDLRIRQFMNAFFGELETGRVDLTILAQLVRCGDLTPDMEQRLREYRSLAKSRIGTACSAPRSPPRHIAHNHTEGKLCQSQRCLMRCPNVKFLPESLEGIAMAVEELKFLSDNLPRETWLRGNFDEDLSMGEQLLDTLYPADVVATTRERWRNLIHDGKHLVPGFGFAKPNNQHHE